MKECVICKIEKKHSEFTVCRSDFRRCDSCHTAQMEIDRALKFRTKVAVFKAREQGDIKATKIRQTVKNTTRLKIEDILMQRELEKELDL